MNLYVADTHALFWYLVRSSRLGAAALRAFEEGANAQATILIPAIVLAEFYFMNAKLGRPIDFGDAFRRIESGRQYVLVDDAGTDTLDFDANASVTEMHDRMIVGLALRRGASPISGDRQITQSGLVPMMW
jgi:predicted nucleic acid-binding protein